MIQAERIVELNGKGFAKGRYVLYWMQASQRTRFNHALEYAIEQANALKKPVVVFFGLVEDYPGANARHYHFMLRGLREVKEDLAARGIAMVIRKCSLPGGVIEAAREACLAVTDRGYLRHQKAWRQETAAKAPCRMVQVESDAVVPVETASEKEEYSAATIRKKIQGQVSKFLIPLRQTRVRCDSLGLHLGGEDLADPDALVRKMKINHTVAPAASMIPGSRQAHKLLREFVRCKLARYEEDRNDPNIDGVSGLSPYLHFGQISPVEVALQISKAGGTGSKAFLEELIVRRELAINFVFYNPKYDTFDSLPPWAKATLRFHQKDKRAYRYSFAELEQARTHDRYWNAAQTQMVREGKMHGYMRMYWGKKILEWSASPAKGFSAAMTLNDRYELDGRDANGCAGVAWCFGKHDRPWGERPVFGMVRYMNAAGLERKFDADAYARRYE